MQGTIQLEGLAAYVALIRSFTSMRSLVAGQIPLESKTLATNLAGPGPLAGVYCPMDL